MILEATLSWGTRLYSRWLNYLPNAWEPVLVLHSSLETQHSILTLQTRPMTLVMLFKKRG